jgi:hypothetical protein
MLRLGRYVVRTEEIRNAYNIFAGKPEGSRPLERPKLRWDDNINMFLEEIEREGRTGSTSSRLL